MTTEPSSTSWRDVFAMSYPRPDWGWGAPGRSAPQRRVSSPRRALSDWLELARAVEAAGGQVVVVPPAPHLDLPGLPYMAQAGVFFVDHKQRPSFLLPRTKREERRPEAMYLAGFVAALGLRPLVCASIWEAQGDTLRVDDRRILHTYGVGPNARTARGAYAEVAPHLSPEHLQLQFRASPWPHGSALIAPFWRAGGGEPVLMVCLEALADGELARLRAWAPDLTIVGIDPTESLARATQALQVGDTVIAPLGLPSSVRDIWRGLGLTVVELPLNALFSRGPGAASSLTNRLYGLDLSMLPTIPQHLLFSNQREALEALLAHYPTHND